MPHFSDATPRQVTLSSSFEGGDMEIDPVIEGVFLYKDDTSGSMAMVGKYVETQTHLSKTCCSFSFSVELTLSKRPSQAVLRVELK